MGGGGVKLPKVKISAPKITADPGKLISNVSSGVTKAYTDVAIKPAAEIASASVAGVGQVLSQPGAGAVLSAGGAAFGIPPGLTSGLVGAANSFQTRKEEFPQTQAVMPATQQFVAPSNNSNMILIIGGLALAGILAFVLIKRK